jgi:hypothetical protein
VCRPCRPHDRARSSCGPEPADNQQVWTSIIEMVDASSRPWARVVGSNPSLTVVRSAAVFLPCRYGAAAISEAPPDRSAGAPLDRFDPRKGLARQTYRKPIRAANFQPC